MNLKVIARERMARKYGTLIGATVIYMAIGVAVFMAIMIAYSFNLISMGIFESQEAVVNYINEMSASQKYMYISQLISVAAGALLATISVGLQYMCLKTARGQDVKISDLFYVIKSNPDKVIIIYVIQSLIAMVCYVPYDILTMIAGQDSPDIVISIVSFVLNLVGIVGTIVVNVLFSQSMFLYIDNPQEKVFTCIELSVSVMKSHFFEYVMLGLSFIFLMIISLFSCGVGFIFLMPYMNTVFALYYMRLKGELGSTIDVTIE